MKKSSLLSLVHFLSNQENDNLLSTTNTKRVNVLFQVLASERRMQYWATYHQLSIIELYDICLIFIATHINKNSNNSYAVFFAKKQDQHPIDFYQKRYRLLMNLFHPDKQKSKKLQEKYEYCAPLITSAYKEIKQSETSPSKKIANNQQTNSASPRQRRIRVVARAKNTKRKIHPYLILSFVFLFSSIIMIAYFFFDKDTKAYFYRRTKPTVASHSSEINLSKEKYSKYNSVKVSKQSPSHD